MSKIIETDKAPKAIGPYSQAVVCGNVVYTSGQIAINPETGNVETETIEAQTEQVCKNIKELLTASGSGIDKVVKTTCFLKNMEPLDMNVAATTITIILIATDTNISIKDTPLFCCNCFIIPFIPKLL